MNTVGMVGKGIGVNTVGIGQRGGCVKAVGIKTLTPLHPYNFTH